MASSIPVISVQQMQDIDSYAVERFGIEIGFMMENAGRSVAMLAREKKMQKKRIVVLSGKGHNGGDGLVAARFLHNWGADVQVIVAEHPDALAKLTKWNYGILKAMFVSQMTPVDNMKFENYISKADLIIDSLLGYNIDGNPRNEYAALIDLANSSKAKILSVDVPSGLSAETGVPYNPCIRADWTLALTLPKKGLVTKEAKPYVGEVWVADMGVPHEAYEMLGIEVPRIFEKDDIVRF